MGLIIDENDLREVDMSAEELKLEIAILFYKKGRMSSGRASKFAGLPRLIFLKELGKRKVPVNYDEEELEKDLNTLGLN